MAKKIYLYKSNTSILVDNEDYEWLNKYVWSPHYNKNIVYARAWVNGTRKFMHQLILPCTDPNLTVDHINGDGLDNQRENLRLATRSQQGANRLKIDNFRNLEKQVSEYKGVTKRGEKFRARIRVNDILIDLGTFKYEIDAAKAYDDAAKKYFGEFAVTNQIDEQISKILEPLKGIIKITK